MTLRLEVDAAAWRRHLRVFTALRPGLVPVIKGNGYGFGTAALAQEAQRLGVAEIALNNPADIGVAEQHFSGDILVMTPWLAHDIRADSLLPDHVSRTLSHSEALDALVALAQLDAHARLNRPRVVLECLTSMNRHGMELDDLTSRAEKLSFLNVQGYALHLPLPNRAVIGNLHEASDILARLTSYPMASRTVYVSHLTVRELRELEKRFPQVQLRPRIGSDLWLGDRHAFRAKSTILEVRQVAAGESVGYLQNSSKRPATLLIVGGGTAHGVGLRVESVTSGWISRVRAWVRAGYAATVNRSPFFINGRRARFADTPHMQVSALYLPHGVATPHVGEEIDLQVRMTGTFFDRVTGLEA